MTFRIPLERRRRIAAGQKAKYWSDPEFRLYCINKTRARSGKPPISDLSEMSNPRDGRRGARRDARGRFARCSA